MTANFKPTIVLDFDDTLVKSGEAVIKILNKKYGTNKTIYDSKDWNFRSVKRELGEEEINEIFGSKEFFEIIEWNNQALEFLKTFKSVYNYLICSKGTKQNLKRKEKLLEDNLRIIYKIDFEFIGLEFYESSSLNKSAIDFSNCLFCIDDNTEALLSINTPYKFLIRNYIDTNWNQIPENSENVYVVNNFAEIIEICKYDLFLKREGIKIGI